MVERPLPDRFHLAATRFSTESGAMHRDVPHPRRLHVPHEESIVLLERLERYDATTRMPAREPNREQPDVCPCVDDHVSGCGAVEPTRVNLVEPDLKDRLEHSHARRRVSKHGAVP
jgi:hypothetical protein